jgi:hypothetical protein
VKPSLSDARTAARPAFPGEHEHEDDPSPRDMPCRDQGDRGHAHDEKRDQADYEQGRDRDQLPAVTASVVV